MFFISCNQLNLTFSDGTRLWEGLTFTWSGRRLGIVGGNGSGKTSLLRILTGELSPTDGSFESAFPLTSMVQDHRPFFGKTLPEVCGLEAKLSALQRTLEGNGTPEDLLVIDDDWDLEDRFVRLLQQWRLGHLDLDRIFDSLSGGEQSRLLLLSLSLQKAPAYILDEPSNHLDSLSREALFEWIAHEPAPLVIVSHDRELLRKMDAILELSPKGARLYGGNYELYREIRETELERARLQFEESRKELRKAKAKQQRAMEKQQKHSARGEKQNKQAGLGKSAMNQLKMDSEKTQAGLKKREEGRVADKQVQFDRAKEALEFQEEWKIDMAGQAQPKGKILVEAEELNFAFLEGEALWEAPLNFQLRGGQRTHLQGENGSGKSTLIRLLRGELQPSRGRIRVNSGEIVLLDQDQSFLRLELNVLENLRSHCRRELPEHELRIRLSRFRFEGEAVFQAVSQLSGGERMRLALACLLATDHFPELLILDEPTNHLDLQSKAVFSKYLDHYQGAILLVSHDPDLVSELSVLDQTIQLTIRKEQMD